MKKMKKQVSVAVAATVLAAALVFTVARATQKVPDTMTMESKVYEKHTKTLVTFTHKKHAEDYKLPCTDCHHVYKDGKNVWKEGDDVQKCDACHSEAKMPKGEKMSKEEKVKKYHYNAIHENCVTCHRAEKKKGKEVPTKCAACHPKQT